VGASAALGNTNGTLGCDIQQVLHWNDAVDQLKGGSQGRADLVITHWGGGHGGNRLSAAEELLAMRHDDLFAPVIVFASRKSVQAQRERAMTMGAQATVYRWEDLFREIERLLEN
jgi:hypothetical protein